MQLFTIICVKEMLIHEALLMYYYNRAVRYSNFSGFFLHELCNFVMRLEMIL